MKRIIAFSGLMMVLGGCGEELWRLNEAAINKNATSWPRYLDKMPATSSSSSSSSSASAAAADSQRGAVVLLFPPVEAPQVLHWDGQQSFRLVLTQTPASVVRTIAQGRPIGDLRTRDFEVTDSVYAAIRCGFGRRWAGPDSSKKIYAAVYFCAAGEDVHEARRAASSVVEHVLDDLRDQAVKTGANVASDIRCYLVKSPKPHLWCEATGEERVSP